MVSYRTLSSEAGAPPLSLGSNLFEEKRGWGGKRGGQAVQQIVAFED